METIKVLVVDDSAFMRKMISEGLARDPEIEVVGTAMDGMFAIKKIADLRPDVVTLDVNMPRMDGIETLRHIVEHGLAQVIMVSSLTQRDAEVTLNALNIGAFDFVLKPQNAISLNILSIRDELVQKVKAAARSPLPQRVVQDIPAREPKGEAGPSSLRSADHVLAIGTSTGGPNALSHLLPGIPGSFPAGILVVQHMPAGFTGMFAARLNKICEIEVREAKNGDLVLPGRALIAPGDRHLKVKKAPFGAIAVISTAPPVNGHRPSADVLFRSVAQEFRDQTAAIIMTGMGSDGAEGIGDVLRAGGMTVAQDERSCVVPGMPQSAVRLNHIRHEVPLDTLGDFIIRYFTGKEDSHAARCS